MVWLLYQPCGAATAKERYVDDDDTNNTEVVICRVQPVKKCLVVVFYGFIFIYA